VIVIVSDLHLGKIPSSDERSLAELHACMESLLPDLKQVLFLGDVFDAFIEYPGILPKPVERWTKLVQDLQKRGIEIRFFSGNHDRWHDAHLERTLNIPVWRAPRVVSWQNQKVWLEHGDLASPHPPLVRFSRYISDRRWALALYRTALPFGWGHALAAFISRKYSDFEPDPKTIEHLRSYARDVLDAKSASVVVMGHCHHAGLDRFENGAYLNTGDWFGARTYAVLSDRIRLCRWTPEGAEVVDEEIFLAD
jgi:UDP-2,3-diacylglucosamine hydrolase